MGIVLDISTYDTKACYSGKKIKQNILLSEKLDIYRECNGQKRN
jgi:hypothetical protein